MYLSIFHIFIHIYIRLVSTVMGDQLSEQESLPQYVISNLCQLSLAIPLCQLAVPFCSMYGLHLVAGKELCDPL